MLPNLGGNPRGEPDGAGEAGDLGGALGQYGDLSHVGDRRWAAVPGAANRTTVPQNEPGRILFEVEEL